MIANLLAEKTSELDDYEVLKLPNYYLFHKVADDNSHLKILFDSNGITMTKDDVIILSHYKLNNKISLESLHHLNFDEFTRQVYEFYILSNKKYINYSGLKHNTVHELLGSEPKDVKFSREMATNEVQHIQAKLFNDLLLAYAGLQILFNRKAVQ